MEAKMEEVKYYPKKSKKPLRAIRYFCFECMGWDRRYKDSGKPFEDVKGCTDKMCPLFDFRMGRNPFHTINLTDEQRVAIGKRLRKQRSKF